MKGVELFCGARGFEAIAHRSLGVDLLGIDHWQPAIDTSLAAGLRAVRADVSALDPIDYACEIGEDGILVASPPCQSRSTAGKQLGAQDVEHVARCMMDLADGRDTRSEHKAACADERSILTVEPLRWALALRPRAVLLEQVPPVLPDWELVGSLLERVGYRWWAGLLRSEMFGVAQTRERAFLIARRDGKPALPPEPTHHRFVPNEPRPEATVSLLGEVLPWVSMAECLGWGMTERPSVTVVGHSESGGRRGIDGGSGSRATLADERERGAWMRANGQENAAVRSVHEPAPTITSTRDTADRQWVGLRLRAGTNANDIARPASEPATTIAGDSRVFPPGGHHVPGDQSNGAIRVTPEEAAALQSFPRGWPFQGSRTAVFTQIGNAVSPLVGEAVLRTVLP